LPQAKKERQKKRGYFFVENKKKKKKEGATFLFSTKKKNEYIFFKMEAAFFQNVMIQIIIKYHIKLSKYVWFEILRKAGLQYCFGSEIIEEKNGFLISIALCKSNNFIIFPKFYLELTLMTCFKIAIKNSYYRIAQFLSQFITMIDQHEVVYRYGNKTSFLPNHNSYINAKNFERICKNKNTNMIRYFVNNHKDVRLGCIFKNICKNKNIENIKIIENRVLNERSDYLKLFKKGMIIALKKNNMVVASYLYEKYFQDPSLN
jgi:hypothetical protein